MTLRYLHIAMTEGANPPCLIAFQLQWWKLDLEGQKQ